MPVFKNIYAQQCVCVWPELKPEASDEHKEAGEAGNPRKFNVFLPPTLNFLLKHEELGCFPVFFSCLLNFPCAFVTARGTFLFGAG